MHDHTPSLRDVLKGDQKLSGYIGFDPTSDSLHLGSLIPIMILAHFQRKGHKPYALVGGATGMIGDPSGKSQERHLLDKETLRRNQEGIAKQLHKFLDFDHSNAAVIVNNYDWFKDVSLLSFMREVGKHISLGYMLAKDSVQRRLESGITFTEFSYQLIQGYDFYYLEREYGCTLQMGGSDQWGNITTGTELIRRISGKKAYGMTTPLLTKADGGKFGKTEGGNIWLDKTKTSVYNFHQFWMNISDLDAERYIKIFTFLNAEEIEDLYREHQKAPYLRVLQNAISESVTSRVHSREEFIQVRDASKILFGKSAPEALERIPEALFWDVFEGVPTRSIARSVFEARLSVARVLSEEAQFMSYSESLRAIKQGALSLNKVKVREGDCLTPDHLINGKYVIIQKGKKNFFIMSCC